MLRSGLRALLAVLAVHHCVATVGNWTLVFFDDFDNGLNDTVWSVADNFTHGSYEYANGETELQLYTRDNVYVEEGNLVIRTQYDPATAKAYGGNGRNYTSGWVESSRIGSPSVAHGNKTGFVQAFGRFEVRAKLPDPSFAQIWPAIWMMPEPEETSPPHLCWPAGGEIDIMELWGGLHGNRVSSTLHFSNASQPEHCGSASDLNTGHVGSFPPLNASTPSPDWSADFHVWALEWSAESVLFYLDDALLGAADASQVIVPQTPFFFILNTAICGKSYCQVAPGPAQRTVYHYVDWVKAYR